MNHLHHNSTGVLMHGPNGHLAHSCPEESGGCACGASPPCTLCADATPSQFHVSFVGVNVCSGCIVCAEAGVSVQVGGSIDGTYLLTRNGSCAWTCFSTSVPVSATVFGSIDCSGTGEPVDFAIQLVRINSSQFRLQVTDDTNTMLVFDAIVNAVNCCQPFTTANGLGSCACSPGDATTFTLGNGGIAAVTPC